MVNQHVFALHCDHVMKEMLALVIEAYHFLFVVMAFLTKCGFGSPWL